MRALEDSSFPLADDQRTRCRLAVEIGSCAGGPLVCHDLEKMKANASRLPAELTGRMANAGVIREPVENITLPPALHFGSSGSGVHESDPAVIR